MGYFAKKRIFKTGSPCPEPVLTIMRRPFFLLTSTYSRPVREMCCIAMIIISGGLQCLDNTDMAHSVKSFSNVEAHEL